MNKTIEVEGKEGDEPKFEEIDEVPFLKRRRRKGEGEGGAPRVVGASSPWTRLLTCPLLSTTVQVVDVLVAVHRQGVDVPAVMQRRCLALGGATDSVHRWSLWFSSRGTCDEGGRSSSHR